MTDCQNCDCHCHTKRARATPPLLGLQCPQLPQLVSGGGGGGIGRDRRSAWGCSGRDARAATGARATGRRHRRRRQRRGVGSHSQLLLPRTSAAASRGGCTTRPPDTHSRPTIIYEEPSPRPDFPVASRPSGHQLQRRLVDRHAGRRRDTPRAHPAGRGPASSPSLLLRRGPAIGQQMRE